MDGTLLADMAAGGDYQSHVSLSKRGSPSAEGSGKCPSFHRLQARSYLWDAAVMTYTVVTLGAAFFSNMINIETGHSTINYTIQYLVCSFAAVFFLPIFVGNYQNQNVARNVYTSMTIHVTFLTVVVIWYHRKGNGFTHHVLLPLIGGLAAVAGVIMFLTISSPVNAERLRKERDVAMNNGQRPTVPSDDIGGDVLSQLKELDAEASQLQQEIDRLRTTLARNRIKAHRLTVTSTPKAVTAKPTLFSQLLSKCLPENTDWEDFSVVQKIQSLETHRKDARALLHKRTIVPDTGLLVGLVAGAIFSFALTVSILMYSTNFSLRDYATNAMNAEKLFSSIASGHARVNGDVARHLDFGHMATEAGKLASLFNELAAVYCPARYTGAILAMLAVLASCAAPIRTYLRLVRDLRQGIAHKQEALKAGFNDVNLNLSFVGMQISTFVTGWSILYGLVSLTIMLFGLSAFREWLWGWNDWLVSFVVLLGLQMIITKTVTKQFVEKGHVIAPRPWFIYANVMILLNVVRGAWSAFTRLCYFLGYAIVAMYRLDFSLLPPPLMSLDKGHRAFMSLAVVHHYNMNPAMLMAAEAFQDGLVASRARSRARKKWDVAVLLARRPHLSLSRKLDTGEMKSRTVSQDDPKNESV